MKSPQICQLAALAAVSVAAASTSHAQSVIYREVFGNSGGSVDIRTLPNAYGWETYASNGGQFSSNNAIVSADTTSPSNLASLPAVNSGATGNTPLDNGRTFFGGVTSRFLSYTSEYVVDRSAFTVNTIQYDQRGTGPAVSVAVRIDGSWFVSASIANDNANNVWSTVSHNFATTTWSNLNFTAGSVLSIGSSATLPAGNITAFGIYSESNFNGVRMDGFTINATAIPEPSAFAALAGLGALGLVVSRRRSRA